MGNSLLLPSPDGQYRAKNILAQNTVLLARTDNLGVHSHEVVVDGVLLLLLGFLCEKYSLAAENKGGTVESRVPGCPCTSAIEPQEQHNPLHRSRQKPSNLLGYTVSNLMIFKYSVWSAKPGQQLVDNVTIKRVIRLDVLSIVDITFTQGFCSY